MKTIEEQKKYTIYFLLTFGVTILIFVALIIFPLFRGVKKNSQDFIFQKGFLNELDAKAKNFSQLQSIEQKYQSELKKTEELFVELELPLNFIEFLEKNASSSSLRISLSPVSPQKNKEDPWQSLGFRLSLSGSFPNFLKFLEKIESCPYLIKIISLALNSETREENKIKADLSINVYTK